MLVSPAAPRGATSTPPPAAVLSDGTRLSWDELYSDLGPALLAYARSQGIRDPEDLVHDVFIDTFRRIEDFAGDRSGLRSLFFTITYRRIADIHRRHSRRREVLVAQPRDTDAGPGDPLEVEEGIIFSETASAAFRALSKLSDREQRVIRMRVFEEASPREVGQRLGLTSVNVRVIQARAFSKVRALLETEGHLRHPLPIAVGFSYFRCLDSRLPSRGLLADWIRDLRCTDPSATSPHAGVVNAGRPLRGEGLAHAPAADLVSSTFPTMLGLAVVATTFVVGAATLAFSDPRGVMPAPPDSRPEAVANSLPAEAAPSATEHETAERFATLPSEGSKEDAGGDTAYGLDTEPDFGPVFVEVAGVIDPLTGAVIVPLVQTVDGLRGLIPPLVEQVTNSPILSSTTRAVADATRVVSRTVDSTVDTTTVAVDKVTTQIEETSVGAEPVVPTAADGRVRGSVAEETSSTLVDELGEMAEDVVDDTVESVVEVLAGVAEAVDGSGESLGDESLGLLD